MANYYYPLSTRDFAFENIFSSESVSPAIYYSRRAFGFDYFPVINGINNEQTILLFSQPPIYQDDNNPKFILEIAEAAINHDELIFIAEGIFAYNGTIYFEKKHLSVLFFSEKELRISLLKSKMSLPTKTMEKYALSFKTIDEDKCQLFPALKAVSIQLDDKLSLKIALDKLYNHFKGFIYGLVIGQIADDRKKETELTIRLQNITNAFAELKSRLDDQLLAKKGEMVKRYQPFIDKLFRTVEAAECDYYQLMFGNDIDEHILIDYILSKVTRLKSREAVALYLDHVFTNDELLGTADYNRIIDGYIRERGSTTKVFLELRKYIEQFIHIFQSEKMPQYASDDLNNKIKLLLRNITEEYLSNLSARPYELLTDLNGFSYDFETNEVTINTLQHNLDTKVDNEFTFIINAILKFVKSNKGPAQKEMILKIVEEVGNNYANRGKNTLLYQYLENKIDVYSLDNASNLVMKNFVAFVFNPDSLEKLDDFLISKDVEDRWMAFSFWGAYNGFANISGNFTRGIFSANNIALQDYIDDYLLKYRDTVVNIKPDISNLKKPKQSRIPKNSNPDNNQEKWLRDLYDQHVAGQFKLQIDEFREAVKITQLKDFQNNLKSKHQISKKDSLRLFNGIKSYLDPTVLFR